LWNPGRDGRGYQKPLEERIERNSVSGGNNFLGVGSQGKKSGLGGEERRLRHEKGQKGKGSGVLSHKGVVPRADLLRQKPKIFRGKKPQGGSNHCRRNSLVSGDYISGTGGGVSKFGRSSDGKKKGQPDNISTHKKLGVLTGSVREIQFGRLGLPQNRSMTVGRAHNETGQENADSDRKEQKIVGSWFLFQRKSKPVACQTLELPTNDESP